MADAQPFGTGRSVLLTFDDGPEPASALDQILNVLAQNQIVAEFYVIGKEVKSNPGKARAIVQRGHKIQNHSWSHINLATATEAAVRLQVQQTQQIVYQATGVRPTKLRPPYGSGGWPRKPDPEIFRVAHEFSLRVENWDVDTMDWAKPQGIGPHKIEDARRQLMQRTAHASIILMHVQPATARDLPNFIDTLKSWGFSFARP